MNTLPPCALSIGFPIRKRNLRRFSVNFRLSRCAPASFPCYPRKVDPASETREKRRRGKRRKRDRIKAPHMKYTILVHAYAYICFSTRANTIQVTRGSKGDSRIRLCVHVCECGGLYIHGCIVHPREEGIVRGLLRSGDFGCHGCVVRRG